MKAEGKNVILYNLWDSVILKVLKNKPEHISVGAREKDVQMTHYNEEQYYNPVVGLYDTYCM